MNIGHALAFTPHSGFHATQEIATLQTVSAVIWGMPNKDMKMPPATVLVLRHAEKTDDPADPHLSDAGRARARNLAGYIPSTFGKPDFLFASSLSKHSDRASETIHPLSEAVGVPINASIADEDYGVLANQLLSDMRYEGKLVVACWHHGKIPSLLNALNAAPGTYPDVWNPFDFDFILQLDYGEKIQPDVTSITEPF